MRKNILLLMLCLLLVSTGCSTQADTNPSTSNAENSYKHLAVTEIPYKSDWLQMGLEKAGLQGFSIGETAKGHVVTYDSTKQSLLSVYILCDYEKYGDSIYHDSYLAVETDTKILFINLATDNYSGSFGDVLFVNDVDGDKIDEIIIQQTVGVSGGAGQYLSRVFKVIKNEVCEIFSSSTVNLYDTGFTSSLKNDFKMEIQNKYTGYETTIDFKEKNQYLGVYFDETGKVVGNGSILCDSYREFTPEDVDNDGIFELVCLQYVSLYGHSDYIGHTKCIIKYNPQIQEFEIIQSEFIPYNITAK